MKVFIFLTNVNLSIKEKSKLEDLARAKGLSHCEIFDRERIRILLDGSDGLAARYQYLGIPLSEAEQATFFAKWGDDIQGVIAEGFGKLERTLSRLQFLAEASLPLSHITIVLEMDREYLGSEIGHFRAFCSLELVEPRDGVVGLLFGSTDGADRLRATDPMQLTGQKRGIQLGICGRQWKEKLRPGTAVPDRFAKRNEYLAEAGSFWGVGRQTVRQLAIQYDGHTDFVRIPPYLLLRDIDDAVFALFLNQSLANKLAAVYVYANEYEVAQYPRSKLRLDKPNVDFMVPMCFADPELDDPWVRIMRDLSPFRISFSDSTPKRKFSALEIGGG